MKNILGKEINIPSKEAFEELVNTNPEEFVKSSVSILDHLDKNPSEIETYFPILEIILYNPLDMPSQEFETRVGTFLEKYNHQYGFI